MRSTVVIGLGNLLMADEGIGVHLVRALAGRAREFPDVEFMDLGTGGMAVLHALAGRRKAVLLDCARMGEAPGTIRRFTPDEVATLKDHSAFYVAGQGWPDRSATSPPLAASGPLASDGAGGNPALISVAAERDGHLLHPLPITDATPLSLHEGDLLDILALSRRMGECPPTVILFGIQPASLGMGDSLSPALAARFEDYLRIISDELDSMR